MTDTSTDHIRIAACVLALLTFALEASAQSPAAFVGGGIVLSQWHLEPPHQGSPSLRYFTSTPDSLLTGFSADVGVFLSPHFAIGGEFSRPFQRTDITSTNNYMLRVTEIHSRYCESSLFATVRGVWPVGSSGRAGVLGGAGLLVGFTATSED
jgi:hypothetical protein